MKRLSRLIQSNPMSLKHKGLSLDDGGRDQQKGNQGNYKSDGNMKHGSGMFWGGFVFPIFFIKMQSPGICIQKGSGQPSFCCRVTAPNPRFYRLSKGDAARKQDRRLGLFPRKGRGVEALTKPVSLPVNSQRLEQNIGHDIWGCSWVWVTERILVLWYTGTCHFYALLCFII